MNQEPLPAQGPVDVNVGRRAHDPNHPYVRKLVGCGHGRLFSEPCPDCEIVGLHEQYRNAIRTVQIVRDRLRGLAWDEGFSFGCSQFEPMPVAWMTFGACAGEPVFSTTPPDETNLAGWVPLYRRTTPNAGVTGAELAKRPR